MFFKYNMKKLPFKIEYSNRIQREDKHSAFLNIKK